MKGHFICRIFFSWLFLVLPQLAAAEVTGLDITEYDLSMRLDLEQRGPSAPLNTISATAGITFRFATTRRSCSNLLSDWVVWKTGNCIRLTSLR
jgi:hypothetical protein